MTDYAKIETLFKRLIDERRRIVEAAADVDILPPNGLLADLSSLDSAIMAVGAVLEERTAIQASLVNQERTGARIN